MTDATGIGGLVLAGGLSRRMGGGDKSMRMLGGVPMIGRVIDRFAPQVGPLAISANSSAEAFTAYGVPVLADIVTGHAGPLAGVMTGMSWLAAAAGYTHLATSATDAPFVPLDLVTRLASMSAPERIVLARSASGRHPVFGLWPIALRDDLERWLATSDTMKVLAWVQRHDFVWCDFEPERPDGPDPFFNANTPEELAEAEALLAGAVR